MGSTLMPGFTVPALPGTCCVTLGMFLNFSVPQFPPLTSEIIVLISYLGESRRIKWIYVNKALEQW